MTDSPEVWPVVCATGHRPKYLSPAAQDWVQATLPGVARRLRRLYGTTVSVSGMALGSDLWWAEAALDAGLELWAAVPFPQQADRWPAADRATWRRLLDQAAKVRTFGQEPLTGLLHARNDGMLEVSAAVVAVWRPSVSTGGTASAVRKAQSLGLPVVHLDPDRQVVARPLVDRGAFGE